MVTVQNYVETIDNVAYWLCICECGTKKIFNGPSLRRGAVYSCGCKRRPLENGHGFTGTPEHNIWRGMLSRCYNLNSPQYEYYGGRGITVCEEWKEDYTAFFYAVGPRPSKNHSIERINTDGNYEPSNCKWATQKEQCRNRRNNVRYKHQGRNLTLSEWAEILNMKEITLRKRLEAGWPLDRAFSTENFKGKPFRL